MLNWKKKQEQNRLLNYISKNPATAVKIAPPSHEVKGKAGHLLFAPFEKSDRTLQNSSSMTPPALCNVFHEQRHRTCKNELQTELRIIYSHSMVLFELFIDLLLSQHYGAHRDVYEVVPFYNATQNTFAFQIMMGAGNPVQEEEYFDPDLEEQVVEFLSDLEASIESDDIVINYDTLSIEILDKMAMYKALCNLMDEQYMSTPDRYLFDDAILDPDIFQSHLDHAMRHHFHEACQMVQNGDDDILFLTAPNEPYFSKENYLARAGFSNNVDLFMPLNLLLCAICKEDGITPPLDHQDRYLSYYSMN